MEPKHPSSKRYPPELKERAIRMALDAIKEAGGERHGVIPRIARQLGVGDQSLREWVKQAEVDGGRRPGVSSEDKKRIAELERELKETKRANEILKAAATFFGAELDRRHTK